jgi:hypothetical protein
LRGVDPPRYPRCVISSAQPTWPQLHDSSTVSPASWQYSLQNLLFSAAMQLQAGWAHFPSLGIGFSFGAIRSISKQVRGHVSEGSVGFSTEPAPV